MAVVEILSNRDEGSVHASSNIVIPPTPNNTLRNMFNPLSFMVPATHCTDLLALPSGLLYELPSMTIAKPS